ncbi:MAG: inositol monophosphatase [Halobacteriales archaeon]
MPTEADDRAAVARRAAEAGGEVALRSFRAGLEVEIKSGKMDLVTAADRDAQARVVEVLEEAYPNEPVIGEEDGIPSSVPADGAAWIVDPIDGSNNYVRGLPTWATSVAAVDDGEPIAAATYLPVTDDLYSAGTGTTLLNGDPTSVSDRSDPERCMVVPTIWWSLDRREEYARAVSGIVRRFADMRRFGSVQAALAYVASGAIDGALTNVVANPWDTVAGVHLVRHAGGRVTDVAGDPWRHDTTGLVASNGSIHDSVLGVAEAV